MYAFFVDEVALGYRFHSILDFLLYDKLNTAPLKDLHK